MLLQRYSKTLHSQCLGATAAFTTGCDTWIVLFIKELKGAAQMQYEWIAEAKFVIVLNSNSDKFNWKRWRHLYVFIFLNKNSISISFSNWLIKEAFILTTLRTSASLHGWCSVTDAETKTQEFPLSVLFKITN